MMNLDPALTTTLAALISAIFGFLLSRMMTAKAVNQLQFENGQQHDQIDQFTQSFEKQNRVIESARNQQVDIDTALALSEQNKSNLTGQLELAQNDLKQSRTDLAELSTENAELRTSQLEKEKHHKEQLAQFAEQKEALKMEFENLANQILETKSKSFSVNNKASMDELLNPFKTQMKEFRDKVEDIHHKDTQQQTELKTELKQLKELNQLITEEAHGLATALKGQKKMQGQFGEMILENVLDRSGLQIDRDYKREVSFTTEGGRSRPDVVVYLPENKHLVIDAKVSLNAYTTYVNAEDGLVRDQAIKEHVNAVASRIKELADRNYFKLPGLNSPEMVFMFIPIESAFVEAMKADESIFHKALENNVLVATPTTLLTSLNIVRQLWRFEDQNKHTAELADKASKVYDKLNTFLGSMLKVGKSLDNAKDSYEKAYGQLYSGRGNLIKQANEFKQLGVSVRAELPEDLTDKASLELSHQEESNIDEFEIASSDVLETKQLLEVVD